MDTSKSDASDSQANMTPEQALAQYRVSSSEINGHLREGRHHPVAVQLDLAVQWHIPDCPFLVRYVDRGNEPNGVQPGFTSCFKGLGNVQNSFGNVLCLIPVTGNMRGCDVSRAMNSAGSESDEFILPRNLMFESRETDLQGLSQYLNDGQKLALEFNTNLSFLICTIID